jgi:hypothetical protein
MPDGIGGAWMSYSEAAGRLNISREAVRRRADRGHWAKRGNNEDRSVRILVPESLVQGVTAVQDESGTRPEDAVPDAGALVSALESHITTLKAEIERLTSDLAGERAGRQGDVERLMSELASARAAADRATSELYLLARRVAMAIAALGAHGPQGEACHLLSPSHRRWRTELGGDDCRKVAA